jgi:hypothetical protein
MSQYQFSYLEGALIIFIALVASASAWPSWFESIPRPQARAAIRLEAPGGIFRCTDRDGESALRAAFHQGCAMANYSLIGGVGGSGIANSQMQLQMSCNKIKSRPSY